MTQVLVVLGESACGAGLGQALRRRTAPGARFVVVAPCLEPRFGLVVYDDERRDAARSRLQMALASLTDAGLCAAGIVTGPDARASVLDVVDELGVDEVVVVRGEGATRRDEQLLAHLRDATELPVGALAAGPGSRAHTLVVANETAGGAPLRAALVARHRSAPRHFTLLVPHRGAAARGRMARVVAGLQAEGLSVHGVLGHPDPFTAIRNALAADCVDEIVISTHPATRSGWLRRDLVARVRRLTALPVEHLVTVLPEAAAGATLAA